MSSSAQRIDAGLYFDAEIIVGEPKGQVLINVQGRHNAEVLKSYLEEDGIKIELFQEALARFYPSFIDILGRV